MIWVSEVLPPSTKEQLPPYQPEFLRRTKRAETDFQTMLNEEMEQIDEMSILRQQQNKGD